MPNTFNIPSLDGVRAIAVLIVFIGHSSLVPSVFPGHVGVTIFFFLSGYLIVTLLRREHERTGTISMLKFYLRRALRILPPAYLAIVVSVVVGATGVLAASTTGWGILAEALNYTNYYIAFAGRNGLPPESTMLWSLAVEEHYYLVIPALLLILFRKRLTHRQVGLALVSVAIVVPFWRIFLGMTGSSFDRLYVSTDTRIDSLLWGSAMALLMNPALGDRPLWEGRLRPPALRMLAPAAMIVFLASAAISNASFRLSIADTIQCLCLVPIFWAVITIPTGTVSRILNYRWVAHVGVLSFSIYLFHRMALGVAGELFEESVLATVVALAGSVVVAQAVRVTIEKPCARLRKRLEPSMPSKSIKPAA